MMKTGLNRKLPFFLLAILIWGCVWAGEPESRARQALRDLVRKAEEGDPKSLYDLAYLHDTGYDSIPVDSARSTALYLISAEKGYAPARNFIGFRYYRGEAVRQDIDSALYWIRLAARDSDITAAANLGYLLLESPEFKHDTIEATKWLKVAAEAGVNAAQFRYIDLMRDSLLNLSPDSALYAGFKYYTAKAPILGTYLLEVAANKRLPKALALLGDAFSKGLGVPYDHQKSIDNFFMAAEEGDASAQFIVGELLEIFPDASPSYQVNDSILNDAAYWFEAASKKGVIDSETAYSRLYSLP